MGRPSKIPEAIEPEVLQRAAANESMRDIAAWLGKAHGIDVGHVAVARLVKKHREQRAEVTKTVLAERIGQHVTADLDLLERQAGQLADVADGLAKGMRGDDTSKIEEKIGSTPRATVLAGVVGELRQIVALKLRFSGADPDGEGGPGGSRRAKVIVVPAKQTEE
jgi:hypothetical protein